MKRLSIIFLAVWALVAAVAAQSPAVSLLTCSPGSEVYEIYGHTAIRVVDARGIDVVYNFGMFSFDEPGFVYRFVKGETDYFVACYPTAYFLPQYAQRHSQVKEQRLNLHPKEVTALVATLDSLCLPENRTYRYNYVLNNCATRPRDLIEKAVGGVAYAESESGNDTFRSLLSEYGRNYPWYQFGIDLVLGSPLDRPLTFRERLFAPELLREEMADARRADGEPVVVEESILVDGDDGVAGDDGGAFFTPMVVFGALLVFTIFISYRDVRRKRALRLFDSLLFLALGLTGCLVFFLVFFSQHEATSPNWHILWVNPLCFIGAVACWINSAKKWIYCYHFINFAIIFILLASWWAIPQKANVAVLPLVLSVLLRSATNVYVGKKCVKGNK